LLFNIGRPQRLIERSKVTQTASRTLPENSLFSEYLNDGRDEDDADEQAWLDCQEMFPRLKDFDGCEPEPASRRVKIQ
jgi:hypothetical protein